MESDSTLLEAARSMRQEALVAIFDLYSAALYNYALRLCSDPMAADHIVGDVFAKFLDQLAAGKGPSSNLRSYLYQMTYHLIIDAARTNHRESPLEIVDSVLGNGRTASASLEDKMLVNALFTAIQNELTEDQRHVIVLRFLEGFSLRETADIIGKQVYNVKVIQNRGIAKLRKALEQKVSS
jgi:RNA polymerase sigma-70 factor (ECF subfamily)